MRFHLTRWFRGSPPVERQASIRTYRVRLFYTETVRGEPRSFKHELSVEAFSEGEARERAMTHFNRSALESSVGWARLLEGVEVFVDGGWRPSPEDH